LLREHNGHTFHEESCTETTGTGKPLTRQGSPPKVEVGPVTFNPARRSPRLVFDVLSVIFQIVLEDRSNSPWPLAQVDRHWRDTAFSTPSLWASLKVTGMSRSRHRYCDGSEICNTLPRLHRALIRAGASPFDLKIDLFIDGLDNASRNVLVDMLVILSGTKDQWRFLECAVGCYPWRESPLFRGSFPRLIQLTWKDTTTFEDADKRPLDVVYHPPSQLLALVLSEAPALEEISLSQTIVDRWLDCATFRLLPTFNTWRNRFEGALASLRTLRLTKVEPPSGVSRPPLYTPNLETLILDNCGAFLLRHFISPTLRHLKISGNRRISWRSPDLRMVLPVVWTASHHLSERPPSLLSLVLEGQVIGVTGLLPLLHSSPELERLHIVDCSTKDSDKLFSSIEKEDLCLLLTEIDFRELWKPAEVDYELSDIYKFVEARASLPCRTPLRQALYSNSTLFATPKVHDLVRNVEAWKSLEPIL